MKGKLVAVTLILVILGTPIFTGHVPIPPNFDEVDDTFINIVNFWVGLAQSVLKQAPPSPSPPPQQQERQPQRYVKLEVDIFDRGGVWKRDEDADIPIYANTVAYKIYNDGTMTASNVQITIAIDGSTYLERRVTISAHDHFIDEFSVTIRYDSSKTVSVKALGEGSGDTKSMVLNAILPRYMPDEIAKLFITPNDPVVKEKANEILENKAFWVENWKAIRDWVGNNIKYEYDDVMHGKKDYWQLPRETLESGYGDCEDQAILLCSLLRAIGYSENDVYVICGDVPDSETGEPVGHAWVSFEWIDVLGIEVWRTLEPTAGGFITSDLYDLLSDIKNVLGLKNVWFLFNDVKFKSGGE